MANHPLPMSRIILSIFFIVAGAYHFVNPALYLSMMPPWLPYHSALNLISGAAEVIGGVAILFPKTRKVAAYGLILLLIAVFPANIHLAIHGWSYKDIPQWILIVRLPFQLLFIAWVLHAAGIFPKKMLQSPTGTPNNS